METARGVVFRDRSVSGRAYLLTVRMSRDVMARLREVGSREDAPVAELVRRGVMAELARLEERWRRAGYL